MGNAIAVIVILLSVGFVAMALVDALRTLFSLKSEQGDGLRDPATCDHEWRRADSGTCMPSYSSTGGPDPQETWTLERCPLCGSERFDCTGTCAPEECSERKAD